jgi:hypothetical protein
METQIMAAIVSAVSALTGALGAQVLGARANARAHQFDVYWQAKASAYKALLEHLGEFSVSPTDEAKYLAFLAAHQTALLFASDEVARLLAVQRARV